MRGGLDGGLDATKPLNGVDGQRWREGLDVEKYVLPLGLREKNHGNAGTSLSETFERHMPLGLGSGREDEDMRTPSSEHVTRTVDAGARLHVVMMRLQEGS
jgi:hypothetical protein